MSEPTDYTLSHLGPEIDSGITKAHSALQPGADLALLSAASASAAGQVPTSTAGGGLAWQAGGGDMQTLIYDPNGRTANAFDLSNQNGILDGGVFT